MKFFSGKDPLWGDVVGLETGVWNQGIVFRVDKERGPIIEERVGSLVTQRENMSAVEVGALARMVQAMQRALEKKP